MGSELDPKLVLAKDGVGRSHTQFYAEITPPCDGNRLGSIAHKGYIYLLYKGFRNVGHGLLKTVQQGLLGLRLCRDGISNILENLGELLGGQLPGKCRKFIDDGGFHVLQGGIQALQGGAQGRFQVVDGSLLVPDALLQRGGDKVELGVKASVVASHG